jgi:hypothetical protein
LLQGSNLALLSPLALTNFAHGHLLNSYLPTHCVVHADVDISKGAVADHLAQFPLRNRLRLVCCFLQSLRVVHRIVLDLLMAEVAVLVVVVEVVLVLLIVTIAHLALVEG